MSAGVGGAHPSRGGLGEAEARARIEELLGSDGYRLEFSESVVGNRSPMESELMGAIGEWIAEHDPGAETVPTILPGFTDSRWFRVAFPECVAYGFFPQKHMTLHDCAPLTRLTVLADAVVSDEPA